MCLMSSIGIIALAGVCSGMTVGYLSIDEMTLEMKLINGTE